MEHIDPKDVLIWRDGGTGNMGDHTDETSTIARLHHPDHRIALVFVRAHFNRTTGSGTETADLTMNLDSGHGEFYDFELFKWELVGEAEDCVLRIKGDELAHFLIDAGDDLVFEWAHPDSNEITWGLEVGYIMADMSNA